MNKNVKWSEEDFVMIENLFKSRLLKLKEKIDVLDRSVSRDRKDQWEFICGMQRKVDEIELQVKQS